MSILLKLKAKFVFKLLLTFFTYELCFLYIILETDLFVLTLFVYMLSLFWNQIVSVTKILKFIQKSNY